MLERDIRHGKWESDSPLIGGLEEVIHLSKSISPSDETSWHEAARESTHILDPQYLAMTGGGLLREIPFEQVASATEAMPSGEKQAIRTARMGRKLFLIARDSISLSTQLDTDEFSPSDFVTLLDVCQSLGQLADSQEPDAGLATTTAEKIRKLETLPSKAVRYTHEADALQQKVEKWLHTDSLTHQDTSDPVTHDTFHTYRKDFRRVAHSYALVAAHIQDPELMQFSAHGLAMSKKYGHDNKLIKH